MKQRFYIYPRRGTYYLQDSRTGKQQSLETKDKQVALRLLEFKRQTVADPGFNQFILKTCLSTQDPLLPKRMWETVMAQMQTHGKNSTKIRCARAMKSKAFTQLRHVKLVETTAEDFLTILTAARYRLLTTSSGFTIWPWGLAGWPFPFSLPGFGRS